MSLLMGIIGRSHLRVVVEAAYIASKRASVVELCIKT
jgi:hypothetical protein